MAQSRARICIIDLTGVSGADTQVASAIASCARSVRLLGAEVILTGIQPLVSQALVDLDVELRGVIKRGTLQLGISYALDHK